MLRLRPQHRLPFVVLAVAAVAAVAGCQKTIPDLTTLDDSDDLVECGHDSVHVPLPIVGVIRNVPEFHDCQRFIVVQPGSGAWGYDSLHAIFASERLDSAGIRLRAPIFEPAPIDTVVGRSAVTPTATGQFVHVNRLQNSHFMVAVGLVYSEGSYAPLHLRPGVNCLYVGNFVFEPTGDTVWFAVMDPQGISIGANCDKTASGQVTAATSLQVIRTQSPEFPNDSAYPPVARWDWDPDAMTQYVGIKCGDAWCEIGAMGLTTSALLTIDSTDSPEERMVRSIKGWYDQQYLAKEDRKTKTLVPSRVLGTVIPVPALKQKGDGDFELDFVPVASVELWVDEDAAASENATLQTYRRKFNFRRQKDDVRHVGIEIKGKVGAPLWDARMPNPAPETGQHERRVRFRPVEQRFLDAGFEVPGVVRWRWMKSDEGVWIRCSHGCCEMSIY